MATVQTREVETHLVRPSSDQKCRLCRFLSINLVGFAVPGLAEVSCDIYLVLRAERILELGIMYGLHPLVSNSGTFFAYAYLAFLICAAKFKSQYLARRIVLGGLLGLSFTVFAVAWIVTYDVQHVGQGYFVYLPVFPMFLVGGVGAFIGMVAGWVYDLVRR